MRITSLIWIQWTGAVPRYHLSYPGAWKKHHDRVPRRRQCDARRRIPRNDRPRCWRRGRSHLRWPCLPRPRDHLRGREAYSSCVFEEEEVSQTSNSHPSPFAPSQQKRHRVWDEHRRRQDLKQVKSTIWLDEMKNGTMSWLESVGCDLKIWVQLVEYEPTIWLRWDDLSQQFDCDVTKWTINKLTVM